MYAGTPQWLENYLVTISNMDLVLKFVGAACLISWAAMTTLSHPSIGKIPVWTIWLIMPLTIAGGILITLDYNPTI